MESNENNYGLINDRPAAYTYGSQTGKTSPFADSPYETPFTTQPINTQIPPKKKDTSKAWKPIIAAGVAAAVLVGSCAVSSLITGSHYRRQMNLMRQAVDDKFAVLEEQIRAMPSSDQVSNLPKPAEGMAPGQVYSENAKTVVSIVSHSEEVDENGQVIQMESSGSGFIMSADGYVVTNFHVIDGTEGILVKMFDGQQHDAEVVGFDADNDIALLKLDAQDLPYAQIGSSDELAVGDQVIVIGHPLGNQSATLTVGYVSAKDQVIHTDGSSINMIQTDAAINSGNSGGPLFDTTGRVIGITTAKFSGYSSSGASIEGIGYAIPIDDVAAMLEDLREYGHVQSPYLGVQVREVETIAQSYGLPAGAFVEKTMEGMAADKAGIQAQDIIVNVGGHDVKSVSDLTRVLRKFAAGDTVVATVWRGGETVYISVTLEEKPTDSQYNGSRPMPENGDPREWYEYLKPFFEEEAKE